MGSKRWIVWMSGCLTAASLSITPQPGPAEDGVTGVIVQGRDLAIVAALVRGVGGEVTHTLGIIDAVAAELTATQRNALNGVPAVERIYPNGEVAVAWNKNFDPPPTFFPTLVGASALHDLGVKGAGVTVAVLDSGAHGHKSICRDSANKTQCFVSYDAINDVVGGRGGAVDFSGHGSHVSSVIAGANQDPAGRFAGVAPDAMLVAVKAFDASGKGTYADVIRGLEWIWDHRATYDIRVANLSFSALPQSYYWDDPINQAVMELWQAGIVVVTSAGNSMADPSTGGAAPMTIGVPGNLPYVITVGAMSDADTPGDASDDFLASFSAAGPTLEGFVKPELVAPGGHVSGVMMGDHQIAIDHAEFAFNRRYFYMSGTSQAAAVVSGVVALMLQDEPSLTPDEVKCLLLDSAHAFVDASGGLAYSPLQQGAGVVDAEGALISTRGDCANIGLDVTFDLDGTEHYAGPVRWDDVAENFYVPGSGYGWDASYPAGGFAWTGASPWITADPWTTASPWITVDPGTTARPWITANPWTTASPWITTSPWSAGIPWQDAPHAWTSGLTETMSINAWVEQE